LASSKHRGRVGGGPRGWLGEEEGPYHSDAESLLLVHDPDLDIIQLCLELGDVLPTTTTHGRTDAGGRRWQNKGDCHVSMHHELHQEVSDSAEESERERERERARASCVCVIEGKKKRYVDLLARESGS
jgi:hypothetical protein